MEKPKKTAEEVLTSKVRALQAKVRRLGKLKDFRKAVATLSSDIEKRSLGISKIGVSNATAPARNAARNQAIGQQCIGNLLIELLKQFPE